jgi:hypothetical protein
VATTVSGERLFFDPTSGRSLGRKAAASIGSPRLLSPGMPLING